jgi:hypothetical protein
MMTWTDANADADPYDGGVWPVVLAVAVVVVAVLVGLGRCRRGRPNSPSHGRIRTRAPTRRACYASMRVV